MHKIFWSVSLGHYFEHNLLFSSLSLTIMVGEGGVFLITKVVDVPKKGSFIYSITKRGSSKSNFWDFHVCRPKRTVSHGFSFFIMKTGIKNRCHDVGVATTCYIADELKLYTDNTATAGQWWFLGESPSCSWKKKPVFLVHYLFWTEKKLQNGKVWKLEWKLLRMVKILFGFLSQRLKTNSKKCNTRQLGYCIFCLPTLVCFTYFFFSDTSKPENLLF